METLGGLGFTLHLSTMPESENPGVGLVCLMSVMGISVEAAVCRGEPPCLPPHPRSQPSATVGGGRQEQRARGPHLASGHDQGQLPPPPPPGSFFQEEAGSQSHAVVL